MSVYVCVQTAYGLFRYLKIINIETMKSEQTIMYLSFAITRLFLKVSVVKDKNVHGE